MKCELLSPVGNKDALKTAIHNGADAIYFAGKNYGARKFADNFTIDEIKEAIDYAHLYDVKVYITVNTLMFNEEIDACLDYIEQLHIANVDALIMQDIGLMKIVHHKYPELVIHASTQCHNHNFEGIELLKDFGCQRVVLDRELSLDEIKNIKTSIEKEVFIHGALCVSYSGNCLMSYLNGGRSGNRGQCAQCCRLPYQLVKGDQIITTIGEYLLSPRELNASKHIKELLDAGISSFKIEGRMKSSEYVGFITAYYRRLIDGIQLSQNSEFELYSLFNRKFTDGYLFNAPFNELMNIQTCNHQGVNIGKVISFDAKNIRIKLDYDLFQNDGIRIKDKGFIINRLYNEQGLLVNKVEKGKIAVIDNKINLHSASLVQRTVDAKLNERLANYELKRTKIDILVLALQNQPLSITFTQNEHCVNIQGNVVQRALSRPITKENITSQICKLGNTPFIEDHVQIEMDENVFISLSEINELKRQLVDQLIQVKLQKKDVKINRTPFVFNEYPKTHEISCLVHNEQQAKAVLEAGYLIITDNINVHKQFDSVYKTNRVALKHNDYQNDHLLVTEFGGLDYVKNNRVDADYSINCANNYSLEYLQSKGVRKVTISDEALTHGSNFMSNYNIEAVVYGRLEAMTTKYCPLNYLLNDSKKPCSICKDNYFLRQGNKIYPLTHRDCITTILSADVMNNISLIPEYRQRSITNFRLDFFDESYDEIKSILKQLSEFVN